MSPTQDPWYNATTPGPSMHRTTAKGEQRVYGGNEAASPLACIHQYQFCHGNPSSGGTSSSCGPTGGLYDALAGAAPLFNTSVESLTIPPDELPDDISDRANGFIWLTTLWQQASGPVALVNVMGATSLASQHSFRSGVQGPLPDNQWQSDMTYIWNTSLASIQARFAASAIGTNTPELNKYRLPPSNPYQKYLCANQVSIVNLSVADQPPSFT
jgi:hypothetical protein